MSITENTIQPMVLDEPICSSDSVWYKEDMNTSITTIIDGKAPLVHEHSGYAAEGHTHDGYASSTHEHAGYATADHTHTGFAAEDHNHDADYIAKALQFVNNAGGVEYSYAANCGKNLLTEMAAWPQGVHTAYSNGAVEGNPKAGESWRILCHKTSATIGWVLAFGTSGSVYTNYYDSNWKGWRRIYDDVNAPLWTGEMYMDASHTVIPSKALSDCDHGWLLLWSDYNPGSGVGNTDFATTMIPKNAYTGQTWNGGSFLCAVPRFADSTGEALVVKTIQVYDAQLVGNDINAISPRNDVVLRAVYEF